MLFHVTWKFIDRSEAGQKRSLQLFSKWQPGPGRFEGFYGFADGNGGVALIEAASVADLAKTVAPWTPFLKFKTRAILPVQEASAINGAASAWRDSIR
jgi:uncharacterized protein DUF3303